VGSLALSRIVVKIASIDELDRLVLAYSPRFRSILESARQQIQQGAGIRHDDFWKDLEEGDAGNRPSNTSGRGGGIPSRS
jgi:hypothetical protein